MGWADKAIVLGLAGGIVAMVWLGWWLSRYEPPKRPGYLGDRWKR